MTQMFTDEFLFVEIIVLICATCVKNGKKGCSIPTGGRHVYELSAMFDSCEVQDARRVVVKILNGDQGLR